MKDYYEFEKNAMFATFENYVSCSINFEHNIYYSIFSLMVLAIELAESDEKKQMTTMAEANWARMLGRLFLETSLV